MLAPLKVLVIQASKYKSREYTKRLLKKYPLFADIKLYQLKVIRPERLVQDEVYNSEYDRLVYDSDTVTFAVVKEYAEAAKNPVILPVSLITKASTTRNKTCITLPVKKLGFKNGKK